MLFHKYLTNFELVFYNIEHEITPNQSAVNLFK